MKLLTRSDFDGLVCAVLLVEKGINDVLANVPYAEGAGLWFDHHASEDERLELAELDFEGASVPAPSAAQVIWDYYGGEDTFGTHLLPLLEAVNKTDSGDLTEEEILDPEGWILLSFINYH